MIMDIILILVYLIARITDKNILLRCGRFRLKKGALLTEDEQKYYRPCALCEYNQYCKSHIKLWFKASYIILINVAFVFAYIVLFTWWIIDKYIWNNIGYKIASNPLINNLYNSKQVVFGSVCLVVLLIVTIIALCIVWSTMHKSIEKFKKNIKEHDSKEPNDE